MSLLSMLQRVCNEVGLPEPELAVASTARDVKQLLAITYRVANDLRNFPWAKLRKLHTITLVAGQDSYPFPADYDADVSETHWDTSNQNPFVGPMTPTEWQTIQYDTVGLSAFERAFIIKGSGINEFFISPTPAATEAGDILVFEYQSKSLLRPRTWAASTFFGANSYCFYNGYYFKTTMSGTTGSTAPTPTGLNDGSITWTLYSDPYVVATADTDEFLVDEELVGLGVQFNYLASKGLPYAHLESKYMKDRQVAQAKSQGAGTLSLVPGLGSFNGDYPNFRVIP